MELVPLIVAGLAALAVAAWAGRHARHWWVGLLPLAVPSGAWIWAMLAETTESDSCGFGCGSFLLYVVAIVSAVPAVALTLAFFCARTVSRRRRAARPAW